MQINRISTYSNQNPNFDGNLQVKAKTIIKNINTGNIILEAEDLLINPAKIESITKIGNDIVAVIRSNVYSIKNQGHAFENFLMALRASLDFDLTIFDSKNRTTSYKTTLAGDLYEFDNW